MSEINKEEWSIPIRIRKNTREKLRKLSKIGKEWDIIINQLIDEHNNSKN